MAHIKISDTSPRTQITSTTSQTAFDFPFPIFVDSDLDVYVGSEEKTLSTDYTVAGAGDDNGGTVTFNSGLASGDIVTIIRDAPIQRTSDYQTNGDLLANTLNDDLDKLTMSVQQVEEMHENRTVMLAPMAEGSLTHIDGTIADRADKYLAFTANGDISYTAGTSSDIVPGQTGVDLVAASTEQEGRDAIDVYSKAEVDTEVGTITDPVLNGGVTGTAILDDDTMATASNTTLATSESIKAYVDALEPIVNASNMPRVSQRVLMHTSGSLGVQQSYSKNVDTDFGVSSGTIINASFEIECIDADGGFAVGQVLPIVNDTYGDARHMFRGWTTSSCATADVEIRTPDTYVNYLWNGPDSNTIINITESKWNMYARVYYTV